MKDTTERSNEKITPAFNSSLNYLDRVGGLIRSFEMGMIDGEIKKDSWIALDMLRSELNSRMNTEEVKESFAKRKVSRSLNYDRLVEFFIFLNDFAHRKGLIMKDNVYDNNMPDAVRNVGGRR